MSHAVLRFWQTKWTDGMDHPKYGTVLVLLSDASELFRSISTNTRHDELLLCSSR